jgi:c-di-GMP-binding flagellar brake protein YcgR
MVNISFEVNKKLEILCDDNSFAKSIIQEVEEQCMYIGIPMSRGLYYPLNRGDVIEAYYQDSKGNIYRFRANVIGRKFENIPLIIVSNPFEVHKVQRRKFVRLEHIVEINYIIVDDYPNNPIKNVLEDNFQKGYSLDLSGGGMRVKIPSEVKLGDHIIVSVPIEEHEFLALCKVVRVEKDMDGKLYICGIKFEDVNSKAREKIIQFIFKNMRRAIRSK